jgi:hypothetical protein
MPGTQKTRSPIGERVGDATSKKKRGDNTEPPPFSYLTMERIGEMTVPPKLDTIFTESGIGFTMDSGIV